MDEEKEVRRTEAAIKQAKIDAFGEKADLAKHRTVGSTISETIQISLNVYDNPDLIENMPLPWTENRDMITKAFGDFFSSKPYLPWLGQSALLPRRSRGKLLPQLGGAGRPGMVRAANQSAAFTSK